MPITIAKISVHTTDLHLLSSWNINESLIVGTAKIDEVIVKKLFLDTDVPEASGCVRFLGGDKFSIAQL